MADDKMFFWRGEGPNKKQKNTKMTSPCSHQKRQQQKMATKR
jgi:hypothetical protein